MPPHHPPAPRQVHCRQRPTRIALGANAFTFIEVLIVVLILGIVSALALSMFTQTDVTKLRSAANLLVADLDYARVESIAHGDNPRLIVFDQTNNSYRVATVADPDTPITNPVGNLPYAVTFGAGRAGELAGVTIQSHDLDGDDRIEFGIYGQLDQATAATITLAVTAKTLTISLDPTSGEISVSQIQ